MAERNLGKVDRRRAVDPEEDKTWQDAAIFNRSLIAHTHSDYRKFIVQVWTAIFILIACIGIIFWQVFTLIDDNQQRVSDIQKQRVQFCREQNQHHDRTIKRLNTGIRQIKDLKARTQAEQSRKFTIALIDQLAPKVTSCVTVVSINRKGGR